MRIVVHEPAGYAFTAELSRELARRGHDVLYLSCATFNSPKGGVERRADDPPTLTLRSLRHRRPFDKYHYGRRVVQELEYGLVAARAVAGWRPDVVISGNTPLLSQWLLTELLARRRIPIVGWVQDLYSDAIVTSVGGPRLGPALGRAAAWFERRALRRSRRVVVISDAFLVRMDEWRVPRSHVRVVPNWGPLSEIPERTVDNPWRREQGLTGRFVVAYTGLLGLKHDARVLVDLARAVRGRPRWVVLVVAEGPGARALADRAAAEGLANLVVLPFQPVEQYPDVLASADVLLALLTPAASAYSVPSKVLSYLCAARPVLALLPADNDAARMVVEAGAGEVVASHPVDGVVEVLDRWCDDAGARAGRGRAGRTHAERAFPIAPIADEFEQLLTEAAGVGP